MPKAETKGNNKNVQKTPTDTGVKKRHGDVRPKREKGVKWERKVVQRTEAVKASNPEGFRRVKAAAAKKRAAGGKSRERIWLYKVDCSKPVGEKIFTIKSFAEYLRLHIKVKGKVNNLGTITKVIEDEKNGKVEVASKEKFQKRYLKYLTKRYLKKHQLRDWLRVVNQPGSKNKNEYVLKYYAIYTGGDEEGADEQ